MATQKTPLSGAERMAQVEQSITEFGGRLNALTLDNARAQREITALSTLVVTLVAAMGAGSFYDQWDRASRALERYKTDVAN